jgi:hypothetical protein
MAHPLDNAFKRIERAGKHLSDLDAEIAEYRRFKNESALMHLSNDKEGNVRPLGAAVFDYDPTPDLSILVGEIAHNLRSALDYLIYELARLDSGQTQSRTQFPIESTPQGFNGRRNTFLKGISASHTMEIEALQPYKGCGWTKTLAEISNQDKHRELVMIATPSVVRWHLESERPQNLEPGAKIHRAPQADGTEAYVAVDFVVRVEFSDGAPVYETLQALKQNVVDTLTHLKSNWPQASA